MMIDVLIVGGGPAGLSAALVAARANRSVLLCQSGDRRNSVSDHAHGFLTRDGASPAELAAIGQSQLGRYPHVEVIEQSVQAIDRTDHGFRYALADGRRGEARTVVLATGVADGLPDIPGLSEHWGKRVHSCPYCDAWEYTGQPLATLGDGAGAAVFTLFLRAQWTPEITMLTNGQSSMSRDLVNHLAAHGVSIKSQPITEIVPNSDAGLRIDFADGSQAAYSAVFLGTDRRPKNELARALGCELSQSGHILVDDNQTTSVEGVYAAGDVALQRGQQLPLEQVVLAAASGARCGWAINQQLTFSDWKLGEVAAM